MIRFDTDFDRSDVTRRTPAEILASLPPPGFFFGVEQLTVDLKFMFAYR
jgi:hypothetical protein